MPAKKMFGPGGIPTPYRPHSEATRLKISRAQRARLCKPAIFSEDGSKRYWLIRTWDIFEDTLGLVMLNPSVAGAENDDPTIRKGIGFAKRWGFGGIIVVNVIPVVATDPWELPYWCGLYSDNEPYLRAALSECKEIVVAWGSPPRALRRKIALSEHLMRFQEIAGKRKLYCIGLTRNGDPLHPSRAPYTDEMEPWSW